MFDDFNTLFSKVFYIVASIGIFSEFITHSQYKVLNSKKQKTEKSKNKDCNFKFDVKFGEYISLFSCKGLSFPADPSKVRFLSGCGRLKTKTLTKVKLLLQSVVIISIFYHQFVFINYYHDAFINVIMLNCNIAWFLVNIQAVTKRINKRPTKLPSHQSQQMLV